MTFGFLLFRDVEELDFVGPWEVIGMWGKWFGGPEHRLLVSQTGGVVACGKGLHVQTDCSFAVCPALDYLLIPGGQGAEREVGNAELLAFVRTHAGGCRQVVAVCTGALILQAVGLLAGRRATTYWQFLERLRASGDVTVAEDRFVRDGKIWTAAGVSVGIDVALALVADQAGEDVAGQVQLAMEYYSSARRDGQTHVSPEAPGYLRMEGAASSALHASNGWRHAAHMTRRLHDALQGECAGRCADTTRRRRGRSGADSQRGRISSATMTLSVATCYVPVDADIRRNRRYILHQMRTASAHGADVAHFPEACHSGYAGTDFPSYQGFGWPRLTACTQDILELAGQPGTVGPPWLDASRDPVETTSRSWVWAMIGRPC